MRIGVLDVVSTSPSKERDLSTLSFATSCIVKRRHTDSFCSADGRVVDRLVHLTGSGVVWYSLENDAS